MKIKNFKVKKIILASLLPVLILTFIGINIYVSQAKFSSLEKFPAFLLDAHIQLRLFKHWVQDLPYQLGAKNIALKEYLENLLKDNQYPVSSDDFINGSSEPALDFFKMLNIIPGNYQSDSKITQNEAERISKEFLFLKNKIRKDGYFGKIDSHEHYFYNGDIELFLYAAGSLGISKTVFMPTGLNPDNRGYKVNQRFLLKYWKKLYPYKIIVFCTIDEADKNAYKDFKWCLENGGEGLKLLGGHPDYYDEPLDSENIVKVYEIASKYKVPVLIHISSRSIPQQRKQVENILLEFRDIKFIFAHVCSSIYGRIRVEDCAYFLDNYPNTYADLTTGHGFPDYQRALVQSRETMIGFIKKYQNRLFFGADNIVGQSFKQNFEFLYNRINCEIDLLQSQEYSCRFDLKGLNKGLDLDQSILRKIYLKNSNI